MSAKSARIVKLTKIFLFEIVWINLFFFSLFTLPISAFEFKHFGDNLWLNKTHFCAAAFLSKLLSGQIEMY